MARKAASAKSRKRKPSSVKGRNPRSSVAMRGLSTWCATAAPYPSPALEQNVRADVCVIGAGIAGLTTAYLLAREGKSVVVLEKNKIGGGETSHTSAHLSNALDVGYRKIESLHGETGARLAAHSHSSAISRIDFIVAKEHIDCDFERVDGYLFLGPHDSENDLHLEFEAARRAGVNVKEVQHAPSHLKLAPCLKFHRQAQFHPLKYLAGLAAAFKRYGGRIYTATEARKIKSGKTAEILTANKRKVSAGAVVVATNTPANHRLSLHAKQTAYRSYVIGIPIRANSIPNALYWDTENPFHYVRLQRMNDHLGAPPQLGASPLRASRRARVSLVRPSDEQHRRPCAHRPQSRRCRKRVHRHRRFRYGPHARHHCRNTSHRFNHGTRKSLGRSV